MQEEKDLKHADICEHCHHDHDHDHNHEHEHNHEHTHEHDHSHHDHEHSHNHEHDHHHHDHEEEEELPTKHDHSHDPEMDKYRANESDIMEDEKQIKTDERKAFGHFHCAEGNKSDLACDICGQSLDNCTCDFLGKEYSKNIFHMEHLDCMECAAKMEGKIREMPSVFFAAISFTTKELCIISKENPDQLLKEVLQVCRSVDESIGIIPPSDKTGYKTETYEIPTLDCAACALKLEKLINHQPGVLSASISYATKTMRLTAEDPDSLIPLLTEKCNEVESPTEIHKKVRLPKRSAAHEQDEKESALKELTGEEGQLVIGGILFVIGMLMHYSPGNIFNFSELAGNIFFFISYIILGGPIVWNALKNITHGEFFDETFLMTVATLGAFGIQEYPEAVGVMFFYRIGEYLQDLAAGRSRKQIMDAVDLRPEVVIRVNGEETETIPAEDAKVGDILILRPGDRIPLDGIIIEGTTQIDTSALTGEPEPVAAEKGSRINSGCVNMTGTIRMQVTKILAESMVTRILDSVENAVASKPKIDRFITRFSRIYTPVVVLVALIVAFIPPLAFDADWEKCIYTALTFLVISCPCALVISVPLAFFAGIGTASKDGILFKGGTIIETLAKIKAAVMDKTGTITEGKFKVREVIKTSSREDSYIVSLAAAGEIYSTHPIAKSIVEEAGSKGYKLPVLDELHEKAGYGVTGKLEGKNVYIGNDRLMKEAGISPDAMAGYNGIGTLIYVAEDKELLGCIIIADALKNDAIASIHELKNMGITPVMLTGDNKANAENIAKEAGITDVYANLLPQDKLSIMKEIREKKGSVLFVGDGINDAPVLAGADAGAAMGSGADAAIEAADIVFLNSDVRAIPTAVRLARKVIKTAWQNVAFALIVKIAVMIMGLAGFANMWVAVFADTGVTILCILYSIRLLKIKI